MLYYHTPASLDAGSGSRLQGSFLSPVHKNVFLTEDRLHIVRTIEESNEERIIKL